MNRTIRALRVPAALILLPGCGSQASVAAVGYEDGDDGRAFFADFTFGGGKLGIYNNDFKPADNVPGTTGNPTWRLDRLCP